MKARKVKQKVANFLDAPISAISGGSIEIFQTLKLTLKGARAFWNTIHPALNCNAWIFAFHLKGTDCTYALWEILPQLFAARLLQLISAKIEVV